MPLKALLDDDAMVAYKDLGNPLTKENADPVGMTVPKRHAWKGAKGLKGIELDDHDMRGFGKYVATITKPTHLKKSAFSRRARLLNSC